MWELLSALAEALFRFEPPWLEVGRIYRRICFLRSEGLVSEAARLEENELAQATARAREAAPSLDEGNSLLKRLLSEEEGRVAEAIAFAEILVPMLAKRLSLMAPAPRVSAAPVPVTPAREPRRGQDENRGIADFIDDMLAQEHSA